MKSKRRGSRKIARAMVAAAIVLAAAGSIMRPAASWTGAIIMAAFFVALRSRRGRRQDVAGRARFSAVLALLLMIGAFVAFEYADMLSGADVAVSVQELENGFLVWAASGVAWAYLAIRGGGRLGEAGPRQVKRRGAAVSGPTSEA